LLAYAVLDKSIPYAGRGSMFAGGKVLERVPRLALTRSREEPDQFEKMVGRRVRICDICVREIGDLMKTDFAPRPASKARAKSPKPKAQSR
jgi:hypothetical protein